MATHALFESDLNAPPQELPSAAMAASPSLIIATRRVHGMAPLERSYSAYSGSLAACVIERSETRRRLRRKMTREQGCAIEMIGHAVDYLNDSYFCEGHDSDFIDFEGASTEAVQLLISAQRQILQSIPLIEPLSSRFWKGLLP